MTTIRLENGKYTVLADNNAGFRALRYGEPWRDLTGDGLVLAMAQAIEEMAAALQDILDGTPLDAHGNRNDDGLVDFGPSRPATEFDLKKWRAIAAGALAKAGVTE